MMAATTRAACLLFLVLSTAAGTLMAADTAAPAESLAGSRVHVTGCVFKPTRTIPTGDLEKMCAAYIRQTLSRVELDALRERLTRHVIEQGFLNSGVVLAGEPAESGTVTWQVIEGRIQTVRAHGLERLRPAYLSDRLVRSGDEVVNIDTLRERFQLLLDDPLFDHLNARLLPGDTPGLALLDVEAVRARPYRLTLALDNMRPPSIGEGAAGWSGWVRNLTGFGDNLEGGAQVSTRDGSGLRGNLNWHMPLDTSGTQMSVLLDHGKSAVIEEALAPLNISSQIDTRQIEISQTLVERLDQKISIGLQRARRQNSTYLLGQPFSFTPGEPDGVTRIWSWRFWQEASFRTAQQVLALRSTFSEAHSNLAAPVATPTGSISPGPTYGLWLGQAQFGQLIGEHGMQVIVRLTAQQTSRRLPPLDQLSLGGANSVRGYLENEVLHDRGEFVNLELNWPLLRHPERKLTLDLIPFYDYGHGRNQGMPADFLSSAGLAGRLHWGAFSMDLTLGKRLRHSDNVVVAGSSLQAQGVQVRIACELSGK